MAAQVSWMGGAGAVTEEELLGFLEQSHCVLVLDGLDEVADITTRTRLVEEIREALARFEAHVLSLQVVVTSRPAAFANSPGFPEDEWIHVELEDLGRGNIEAYKEKWTVAQELEEREREMVSATLETKLEQPHLRDLARNPMQLAILLHLIHVLGVALPEKRTTLYEEYMKLFFNREAEKSEIVQNRRELIMSIHGVLAWELQTQAEQGLGSGSLTKDALRAYVRRYLESEEYDLHLVDPLLRGSVERVGALVSRLEGTYEFEVQPLREYFAARYLYTTAPYSPAGRPRRGTLPDRFSALIRSSYWTNVTRFFCGFFDVGELGTLVDGLVHVEEEDGFRFINQPRRIAMMLLSDHVFAQSPKTMRRLIGHVTSEPGFQRLTASETPFGIPDMALPETAGRKILYDICLQKLEQCDDSERRRMLREVMRVNANRDVLVSVWKRRFRDGVMNSDPLQEALDFEILDQFSTEEIERATNHDLNTRMRWLTYTGKYEQIIEDQDLHEIACREFFDGRIAFFRPPNYSDGRTHLDVLSVLLTPHGLASMCTSKSDERAASVVIGNLFGIGAHELVYDGRGDDGEAVNGLVGQFTNFVQEHMNSDVSDWNDRLDRWSTHVDKGLEVAPSGALFEQIAAIATVVDAGEEAGAWRDDGFCLSKGLVERLYYARGMAGDTAWWKCKLAETDGPAMMLLLAMLFSWAKSEVLRRLSSVYTPIVDGVDESSWERLYALVRCIRWASESRSEPLCHTWFGDDVAMSPRLASALIGRVRDADARRMASRKVFGAYAGEDRWILQQAADFELSAVDGAPSDVDWEYIGRLSKLARKAELPYLFSVSWPQHEWKIREDVSEAVLGRCETHCGQLVSLCERSYRAGVAERIDTVSKIAAMEGWFDDDPELSG